MWGTNQHGQLSLNSSSLNNQIKTSAHELQYLQLLYMQHSHTYGVNYIQRNVILTGFPLLRSEQKRHTESDTTTLNRLGRVTVALPRSRWQPVTHHGLGELCNTPQQHFRTSLLSTTPLCRVLAGCGRRRASMVSLPGHTRHIMLLTAAIRKILSLANIYWL